MDFFGLAGEKFDERVGYETETEAMRNVVCQRHPENDEKCRDPLVGFFEINAFYG